ncbi:MAG: ATP-binding cassette domain-containing protein [Alistipes sp.]|nr:ATP-binding cassette domain-containing protein [Alistipes sp.]
MTEQNKCVASLTDVAIYHSPNPFASLSKRSYKEQGELVLADVTLRVNRGDFLYLIGRVGSGKSSLLKLLYAELPLLEGEGHVAGFDLKSIRRKDIPMLRRKLGIVFQEQELLSDRNVEENLRFVLCATGWKEEARISQRIDEVLAEVGLENKHYKMPFELSGGERQRLVVARALLNSPDIILADEPTGNLDPVTAESIVQLFHRIAASGTAVIMSTHNTAFIESHPSRTLLFAHNRVQEIDVEELLGAKSSI